MGNASMVEYTYTHANGSRIEVKGYESGNGDFIVHQVLKTKDGVRDNEISFPFTDGSTSTKTAMKAFAEDNGYTFEEIEANVETESEVAVVRDVTFTVINAEDAPVEGATVDLDGEEVVTDVDGIALFEEVVPNDGIAYTVTKATFVTQEGTVDVVGADVEVPITLVAE